VQESGVRNGSFGADKFGLQGARAIHWNLTEPRLYEFALAAKEAECNEAGSPSGGVSSRYRMEFLNFGRSRGCRPRIPGSGIFRRALR